MIFIQAKTLGALARIFGLSGIGLGALLLVLRYLTPDEKKAWGIAVVGYLWAAVRYIFTAGTISQRLHAVESKQNEMAKQQIQIGLDVAFIKGELSKMNGRHH